MFYSICRHLRFTIQGSRLIVLISLLTVELSRTIVPVMHLEIERFDAYHAGYLMYLFMKACAMSAYLMDVNPFDQPRVEFYKKNTNKLLQKNKKQEAQG